MAKGQRKITKKDARFYCEMFESAYRTPAPTPDEVISVFERMDKEIGEYVRGNYETLNEQEKEGLKNKIKNLFHELLKELKSNLDINVSDDKQPSTSNVEKTFAKRIRDLIIDVDKITKTVFDSRKNTAFYENAEVLINVGTKGKAHTPVRSIVSINIDKLENISISNDVMLNPYNRVIHNIAVSLYVAGNTHITPAMIYHIMNGGRRKKEVPEKVRQDIIDSMRKLMRTFIKIDATEEGEAFGLDKLKFEGYLMPMTLVTAEINGNKVECFKFLDEPPLYSYASKKKQISKCSINLLDANVSMTQDNVVIRDYLLEQILTMQNKKSKRNNVILYDTVYEYLDVDAPNQNALRKKHSDIRNKVKTILDAWHKAGFITGYDEIIEASKIKGLYIKYAK